MHWKNNNCIVYGKISLNESKFFAIYVRCTNSKDITEKLAHLNIMNNALHHLCKL